MILPGVNLHVSHIGSCLILDFLDALHMIVGALAAAKLCEPDPVYVWHLVSPGFSTKIGAYQANGSRRSCRVSAIALQLESLRMHSLMPYQHSTNRPK